MPPKVESYLHPPRGASTLPARATASRAAERDLPQDFVASTSTSTLPVSLSASERTPAPGSSTTTYKLALRSSSTRGRASRTSSSGTLAERVIARLLADTPAVAVTVEVKKFGPPTSASVDAVSVSLTGQR